MAKMLFTCINIRNTLILIAQERRIIMSTILRIDSSSRISNSKSRELGDYFEKRWLGTNQNDRVVRRDIAADPIQHICDETISGYFTAPEQLTDELREATALSDELIGELQDADILLLTVPLYNFSVPSALKAWIDQIVRIGRTFSYDGVNFSGLLTGKHAYIVYAYGAAGYVNQGPMAAYDFLTPYLTFLFGFLGFQKVEFLGIEGTTADNEIVTSNMISAKKRIDSEISTLNEQKAALAGSL